MRAAALIRVALTALGAVSLSACAPAEHLPGSALVAGAGIATLIATDKTITDHVVSLVKDEDCRTTAYFETGHYCQPHAEEVVTVVREPVYCYRTLGDVDCHAMPNPYGGRAQPVSQTFSRQVVRRASDEPGPTAARATFR